MLRCVCRLFCINSYCNYNKIVFSHYQILSDQCLKQVFCKGQFYSYSQANTQVERYWALSGTSNIRNSRSLPRAIAVPDMKTAVWIYENPIWNTALNVMLGYHRWFYLDSFKVSFNPYPIMVFMRSSSSLKKKMYTIYILFLKAF